MDNWKVLSKIEKLIEQLPYTTAHVEIKTSGETYTLDKEKQISCGFNK